MCVFFFFLLVSFSTIGQFAFFICAYDTYIRDAFSLQFANSLSVSLWAVALALSPFYCFCFPSIRLTQMDKWIGNAIKIFIHFFLLIRYSHQIAEHSFIRLLSTASMYETNEKKIPQNRLVLMTPLGAVSVILFILNLNAWVIYSRGKKLYI